MSLARWRQYRVHAPYIVLFFLGAATLIVLALLHHRALGTGYDLGIYDQVVWNIAHGRLFQTTLVYETGGYYDHFEPILALIAPLYWLVPDVRVLIILQALALALGSLPIYLYARERLTPYLQSAGAATGFALLFALSYLLYPALHNANLNDFHEVALTPPLLGFALYGLLTGRRRLTFISLGLLLLVKEDLTVTLLSFSLYIVALRPRGFRRRDGLILGAFALVWAVLVLRVFYPALTHGMPYPFVDRRYPWMGSSPESALKVFLTQPKLVLSHLLQPQKLWFVLRLFAPLLFLPLLGLPVILLAFPILGYLMLSGYEPQWSVQSYYNPPLLPILYFALIEAWAHLATWLQRRGRRVQPFFVALGALLVIGVGTGYYLFSLAPGGRAASVDAFRVSDEDKAAYALLAQVPPEAAVSTEWPLVPQLSQRQRIYTLLARPQEPPDYLLQRNDPGAIGAPIFPYAAADAFPPTYYEYTPVASNGPFRLMARQRSVPMTPLPESPPSSTPLFPAAYAWLDSPDPSRPPVPTSGQSMRIALAWRRVTGAPLEHDYVFFLHLLDPQHPQGDGLPTRLAQNDREAGDGRFPTSLWHTWTNPYMVLDEYNLALPAGLLPGTYELWAGAYDRDTLSRLEIGGPGKTLVKVSDVTVP